jgi:hypothetical protein
MEGNADAVAAVEEEHGEPCADAADVAAAARVELDLGRFGKYLDSILSQDLLAAFSRSEPRGTVKEGVHEYELPATFTASFPLSGSLVPVLQLSDVLVTRAGQLCVDHKQAKLMMCSLALQGLMPPQLVFTLGKESRGKSRGGCRAGDTDEAEPRCIGSSWVYAEEKDAGSRSGTVNRQFHWGIVFTCGHERGDAVLQAGAGGGRGSGDGGASPGDHAHGRLPRCACLLPFIIRLSAMRTMPALK